MYPEPLLKPGANVIKNTSVILTLLFLGLKYRSNLLPSFCIFQGNIAFWHRMTVLPWNGGKLPRLKVL
jgi:hypothetical protein